MPRKETLRQKIRVAEILDSLKRKMRVHTSGSISHMMMHARVPRHVEHALSQIQSFRLSIRTDHVTTSLILESIILRGKYTLNIRLNYLSRA